MSILDNATELDEATARLKGATDDSLLADLRYWSVAAVDAAEDYRHLHEQESRFRVLHAEAQQWVALVTNEIRSRRPGAQRKD